MTRNILTIPFHSPGSHIFLKSASLTWISFYLSLWSSKGSMYHNFWIYNPSQNSSDKNVNNSSGLHSMVFRSPPIYPTSPVLFFTQYPPKLTLNVTILNIPYKKSKNFNIKTNSTLSDKIKTNFHQKVGKHCKINLGLLENSLQN